MHHKKTLRVLSYLLQNSSDSRQVVTCLPPSVQDHLSQISESFPNSDQPLAEVQKLPNIGGFHIDLWKEALDQINPDERGFVLNLLPDEIIHLLGEIEEEKSLSPCLKPIFIRSLNRAIDHLDVDPLPLVPITNVDYLYNCSADELIKIADFMAIYALEAQLKHIIDKKERDEMKTGLNESPYGNESIKFIRFLQKECSNELSQPLHYSFPLRLWDKESTSLYPLIHRFGLACLSRLIYSQPEGFTQLLLKKFSPALKEELSPPQHPVSQEVLNHLRQSIETILKFLNVN